MRKPNGAAICCIIAAVSAMLWCAASFIGNVSPDDGRKEIFKASPNEISEIHIKKNDEDFTIKNSGDGWEFAGADINTDSMAVNNYLSTMLDLKGKPLQGKGGGYGLENPAVTAEYVYFGGKTKTLYLGSKTPPQTEYYLSDDKGNIYTVYSSDGDVMSFGVSSIADMFIYGKDYEDIKSVEVSGKYTLVQDNGWTYNKTAVADENVRRRVTRYLSGMYANRLFAASAENKAAYGLDAPSESVTVTDTNGETESFFIGSVTGDGTYIMTDKNDVIYRVVNSCFDYVNYDIKAFDGSN